MSKQTTMTVTQGPRSWMVATEGDGVASMVKLFGTTTLETPYGLTMPVATVLRLLRDRNPGVTVTEGVTS